MIILIIYLAVIVLMIAGLWKTFEKAGEPGWAAIVPIYNLYVLVKISGKETWWIILYFVPIVSIIATFIISIEVAKKFGKDAGYGIGLALLPMVFWPMLGFSDAQYEGGGSESNDEVLDAA